MDLLRNVTIVQCHVDSDTGNTSLQVAWELLTKPCILVSSCLLTLSVTLDLEVIATEMFEFEDTLVSDDRYD